jgi:hypothetical protein
VARLKDLGTSETKRRPEVEGAGMIEGDMVGEGVDGKGEGERRKSEARWVRERLIFLKMKS